MAGRLEFELAEMSAWRAPEAVDLMLANASLQWVEDHRRLLDHLLSQLSKSGVLAFQVPANHSEPSHTLLRDLCSSPRWSERLGGLPVATVREPRWYIDELGRRGLDASVWQTTYFHLLEGPDPVLEWMRGTTLRAVLERLPAEEHEVFLDRFGAVLRDAYPALSGTVVFPFKRTFVVASQRQTLDV